MNTGALCSSRSPFLFLALPCAACCDGRLSSLRMHLYWKLYKLALQLLPKFCAISLADLLQAGDNIVRCK